MKRILALFLLLAAGGMWGQTRHSYTGTAVVEITDRNPPPNAEIHYYVQDHTGKHRLRFSGHEPRNLLTGDSIVAEGDLLADGSLSVSNIQTQSNVTASAISGAQSTLVMLINFTDNNLQPITRADTDTAVFSTASAVFTEWSYGSVTLAGQVQNWVTIASTSSTCSYSSWADLADQAATAAGVNVNSFPHHVYIFPAVSACGWWGHSTIGGNPSRTWINGPPFDTRVINHELGHSFGLYHSHSLDCGSYTLTVGQSRCQPLDSSTTAYGDTADAMGNFPLQLFTPHFNAFQKERLGWLNSAGQPPLTLVTSEGTYVIDAYETKSTSPKALKIAKGGSFSQYYYLEYRAGLGTDSTTQQGVLFHYVVPDDSNSSGLLDMTPPASFASAFLPVGSHYSDPDTKLTLTINSADPAGGASITVGPPDVTPPTVSITAPAAGTISGSVSISANASDDIAVASVQFKLDGANLGAEDTINPYSTTWNTTTASNGYHVLTAVARDTAGNSTTSAAVTVTVSNADTTAPAVSVTSPATGTSVNGMVTLTATASDNVGVVGVQFKLDGGNLGAEDTTSPYSISWNTATTANGSHALTAVARDAAGNSTTSAAVTVTINNNGDTVAPTVAISSPGSGASVKGTVSVAAIASDNVGVVGVQFKLDGVNLGAEDTTSPYSVSWNTATTANGSHTVTAVGRDAAGNSTTSAAVTVTVNNGDTGAPTVAITSPGSGASVNGTVNVAATASDNVGVVGVQFKLDGTNLGSELTTAPYSISWDTTRSTNGSHVLTAAARDTAGNVAISVSVTATVNNSTDFAFSMAPGSASTATVSAGSAANYKLNVTPTAGFTGSIPLRCSGAPLGATCMVTPNPASVSGRDATAVTVSVTTTARSANNPVVIGRDRDSGATPLGRMWPVWSFALIPATLLLSHPERRKLCRSARLRWILMGTVLLGIVLLSSCGGSASPSGGGGGNAAGTPAGTYTITIGGSAGSTSHDVDLKLTVN